MYSLYEPSANNASAARMSESGQAVNGSMSWENRELVERLNPDVEMQTPSNDTLSVPAFDDRALVGVIIYACVFIVSSVGNLTVFISMCRSKRRKSRITMLIIHLAVADLIVTFIMIPLEVSWNFFIRKQINFYF